MPTFRYHGITTLITHGASYVQTSNVYNGSAFCTKNLQLSCGQSLHELYRMCSSRITPECLSKSLKTLISHEKTNASGLNSYVIRLTATSGAD
jgi:hypothetical protein